MACTVVGCTCAKQKNAPKEDNSDEWMSSPLIQQAPINQSVSTPCFFAPFEMAVSTSGVHGIAVSLSTEQVAVFPRSSSQTAGRPRDRAGGRAFFVLTLEGSSWALLLR